MYWSSFLKYRSIEVIRGRGSYDHSTKIQNGFFLSGNMITIGIPTFKQITISHQQLISIINIYLFLKSKLIEIN